ncbi:MAG: asparagine synthase (glutamine-hydrolyzing) [Coleofasciculus sp. D1-CHI-01]|uniref:asparagine synthase (glutamine-hydrolyzing) n=1 Tax=Coleofasciculus sp. D1-CHI-01 TaxID=3068482 RepID=UPI0032F85282
MCGIAGFSWLDDDLIKQMTRTLAHRGPDQYGVYTDESISLGHRRLSILDLSEHGRQPMSNQDGSIWVVYNGEIYNFQELRQILERKGYTFRSRTDTEVILYAYAEYGSACVEKFNGMFALAIWNKTKRELILARDRLGIKPLYYYLNNGQLIFASEIKAILQASQVAREINPQALYHYVGYEFVPAPDTIFRHIHKLPPGHYLQYREGRVELTQYWDLKFETETQPTAYYEEKMRYLLEDSVRQRLISDVPLGVFLSGGLDSSTVVAMMDRCGVEPIQTFALGYDDPSFSELDYAEFMARELKTQHQVLMVDPITPELLETAVWHLDEPMTDLSTIPFYLICKKAREQVTVCLSGEGGDEVLVGYDRFKASKAHSYYAVIPKSIRRQLVAPLINALPDQPQKKGAINMLKRFIQGGLLSEEGQHMRWQYFGMPEHDQDLFSPDILGEISRNPFAPIREQVAGCNSNQRLDREIYVDLKFMMPDSPLMKVDKMSMAHGLEVRVPFLDHRFVEFCATIPSELKLRGFTTKAIFRSAMKDILPDKIRHRGKQGYSLPIKNWLRQELRDYMIELLTSSSLMKEAFNINYIEQLIQEHLDYRANHNHILWALINLALWHRLFV